MFEQKKVERISNQLQRMMEELEEDIEFLGGEDLVKAIDKLEEKD